MTVLVLTDRRWVMLQRYTELEIIRRRLQKKRLHELWNTCLKSTLSILLRAKNMEKQKADDARRFRAQTAVQGSRQQRVAMRACDLAARSAYFHTRQQEVHLSNLAIATRQLHETACVEMPLGGLPADLTISPAFEKSKPLLVKTVKPQQALVHVPGPSDKMMNLRNKGLGDDVVVPILTCCISSKALVHINLDSNAMCDPGAQALSKVMRYVPTLQRVSAKFNFITDVGGREILYAVPWAENIEKCEVNGNQISPLVLQRIQAAVDAHLEVDE